MTRGDAEQPVDEGCLLDLQRPRFHRRLQLRRIPAYYRLSAPVWQPSPRVGSMRPISLLALLFASLSASVGEPPRKVDLHGDPLPAGADQRLGTGRYRLLG